MPPIRHGRFTLNEDSSRVRRDNSGRYELVVLDEWDHEGGHVRSIEVPTPELLHVSAILQLIAALNGGKTTPRFLL